MGYSSNYDEDFRKCLGINLPSNIFLESLPNLQKLVRGCQRDVVGHRRTLRIFSGWHPERQAWIQISDGKVLYLHDFLLPCLPSDSRLLHAIKLILALSFNDHPQNSSFSGFLVPGYVNDAKYYFKQKLR